MYLLWIFMWSTSALAIDQFEFINSLLNNHQFFAKEKINLTLKQIDEQGKYDTYNNWQVDVSAELSKRYKNRIKEDYSYYSDYARFTHQNRQKIELEAQKKFFSNGSALTLSYDRDWPDKDESLYDNNGYVKDVNTTEYIDGLSLHWQLPLMRNRGGVLDQKSYDLSVLEYQDEALVFNEAKEKFIQDKLEIFLAVIDYQARLKLVQSKLSALRLCIDSLNPVDHAKFQRSLAKIELKQSELAYKLEAERALMQELMPNIDLSNDLVYRDQFDIVGDLAW